MARSLTITGDSMPSCNQIYYGVLFTHIYCGTLLKINNEMLSLQLQNIFKGLNQKKNNNLECDKPHQD